MVNWKRLVITEAAYRMNMGIEELYKFLAVATEEQEDQMNKIIENEDWKGFKKLIKDTIGTDLI